MAKQVQNKNKTSSKQVQNKFKTNAKQVSKQVSKQVAQQVAQQVAAFERAPIPYNGGTHMIETYDETRIRMPNISTGLPNK